MTGQALDFNPSTELRTSLRQSRARAGIIGLIGVLALAAGAFTARDQFFRSYLWSYIFVLGITAGSLSWLMLQYLTGGAWGVVIRRPAEAAVRTFPLLALLFIPIALGTSSLYSWTQPTTDATLLVKQARYLNVPFFLVRAAVFFAGWIFLSWFLNRWSAREDREGPVPANSRMAAISGPGLIFWAFSVTFMSIDWVMSLSPHWFSTMFGLLFVIGQGLSGMAFLVTVLVFLSNFRPMSEVLTPRHLHDLGKFLLATVMVWAYFAFSQFLIIWAGNLPEEIPWYVERLRGGWQYVALLLVFGHFALPFALLLSRDLKRNFKLLASIAVFILCMRVVDIYWMVTPDSSKGSLSVSWLDLAGPLGLGGIWLAYFLIQLEKRPLMPLNEMELAEALEHGRE
ncbi:MAG: hypothetical protein LAP40_03875 [Acidobacteriia bacterium]|nr:hypothetical protein [Terriglobia bacterium]